MLFNKFIKLSFGLKNSIISRGDKAGVQNGSQIKLTRAFSVADCIFSCQGVPTLELVGFHEARKQCFPSISAFLLMW